MANNKLYGYTPKTTNEKEGNRLDNYNPYEFRRGMDYELTAMGISRLAESSIEERQKATESVIKNLEEYNGYYTSLITYETQFRNEVEDIKKPTFKAWLAEQDENQYKEVKNMWKKDKMKGPDRKNDKMTEPKYDRKKHTVTLKEAIKKESKKGIAIKKFVLWKSNKEKASDYPSYLCYYLDFSDGRKDPIKRKIYPFEDEKIGLTHFKKLLDENVKKGWEKYNGS